MRQEGSLVLDCTVIDRWDPKIFETFLKLDKRVIEQQGILRVTNVPCHLYEIFGITRLDKIFSLDSVHTLFADDR